MTGMPNTCNNLALRKAGRNLGVLYDEVIASSGLRGGQFSILAHVSGLERPTMKELAGELVMDLSALGHTLKPLERDGYVALVPNELDGRSRRVVLTKAGVVKLREATKLWRAAQDRFERAVGATKAKRMRDMLALLASDGFSTAFRGSERSTARGGAASLRTGAEGLSEATLAASRKRTKRPGLKTYGAANPR